MTQHALISWCEDTNNILQHQIFSTCFYLLCYNIKRVGQMPSLPKCIPEGVLKGGLSETDTVSCVIKQTKPDKRRNGSRMTTSVFCVDFEINQQRNSIVSGLSLVTSKKRGPNERSFRRSYCGSPRYRCPCRSTKRWGYCTPYSANKRKTVSQYRQQLLSSGSGLKQYNWRSGYRRQTSRQSCLRDPEQSCSTGRGLAGTSRSYQTQEQRQKYRQKP